MGKNQRLIKLFVVLFFSTAFIFSFSHFGAQAFENFAGTDGKYTEGTTIGSINVSGKTKSEAISLLEEKYVDWVKNTKFDLQYSELTVPFDTNLFHFDSEQSFASISDGQQNQAVVTIEMLQVEEQLQILFPQLDRNKLELTKLTSDLSSAASQFNNGSYTFNLSTDYLIVDPADKNAFISEAIVELKDVSSELQSVINANPEILIDKEASFSILEFAKNQKIENSSVLNVIATGIYQAILPSNFSIAERNISSVLPDYAMVGLEAKVNAANGSDLVIANPNKSLYSIEFRIEGNKLIVALKGEKLLYEYEISKKDEQQLKPKTIKQYSPLVLPGKIHVQAEGAEGKIVKVYRDIYQENQLIKSELISEDYYPPVYRVEIHGLSGTEQGTATIVGENPAVSSDPNATPSISDDEQQDPDAGLWGKPNEQPK
ncbi:G5 domain-containing protein [Neobacillus vireti]|uniref:G5 domain-containing protein n=1 Tax=Neobacillus vireti TaxID=220686 RepID=UPI002FFF4DD0